MALQASNCLPLVVALLGLNPACSHPADAVDLGSLDTAFTQTPAAGGMHRVTGNVIRRFRDSEDAAWRSDAQGFDGSVSSSDDWRFSTTTEGTSHEGASFRFVSEMQRRGGRLAMCGRDLPDGVVSQVGGLRSGSDEQHPILVSGAAFARAVCSGRRRACWRIRLTRCTSTSTHPQVAPDLWPPRCSATAHRSTPGSGRIGRSWKGASSARCGSSRPIFWPAPRSRPRSS